MACKNVTDCFCPKDKCSNHDKCCACVIMNRETDSFAFCLSLDNDGDKSVANYYQK